MNSPRKILRLYQPHEVQLRFHRSKARFRVLAVGRQAGKSTACNNEIIKRAWENPGGIYWFISPTYAQAKVQFRRAAKSLPRACLAKKPSETELRIELIQGAIIEYKSGESLDNLRGETLDGAVIDEVRDQHPELWPLVVRPMVATTGGWVVFISTPRGFDAFYDLAQTAQHDKSSTWEYMHAPSTCNPLFSQAEFEAAKSQMSADEFAQEILAEFRELHQGSAYVNYSSANERETSPFVDSDGHLYSPYLPFVIGLDFNLSPMAWTIGQKRAHEWYWFDEIWLKKSHTQEAAKELALKILSYPGHRAQSPKIILAGDATAKAGQRAAAGQSDYAILCQILDAHGISWTNSTPDSNPGVRDRVNTVNAKLKSAAGQASMWIHPTNCPMLKRDLQRVVWKQGGSFTLDQTTNPELTHAADGIGYALHALEPISHSAGIGRMAVIRRL